MNKELLSVGVATTGYSLVAAQAIAIDIAGGLATNAAVIGALAITPQVAAIAVIGTGLMALSFAFRR